MKRRKGKWDFGTFHYEPASSLLQPLPEVMPPHEDYTIMICEAIEHNEYVSFDYRHHGIIAHITGHVHYYNENNHCLHIIDTSGKARYLRTEDVVYMERCKEW